METSWQEKRNNIDVSLNRLPPDFQEQAKAAFDELRPTVPDTSRTTPQDPANPI